MPSWTGRGCARLPDGLALHPLVPARLEKSAHVLPGLVDLSEVNADVRAACLERLEVEGGNDASAVLRPSALR